MSCISSSASAPRSRLPWPPFGARRVRRGEHEVGRPARRHAYRPHARRVPPVHGIDHGSGEHARPTASAARAATSVPAATTRTRSGSLKDALESDRALARWCSATRSSTTASGSASARSAGSRRSAPATGTSGQPRRLVDRREPDARPKRRRRPLVLHLGQRAVSGPRELVAERAGTGEAGQAVHGQGAPLHERRQVEPGRRRVHHRRRQAVGKTGPDGELAATLPDSATLQADGDPERRALEPVAVCVSADSGQCPAPTEGRSTAPSTPTGSRARRAGTASPRGGR